METYPGPYFCYRVQRNSECRVGNPISFPTASKVFTDIDYRPRQSGGLAFIRDYRSDGFSYPYADTDDLWAGFGQSWTHNYKGSLYVGADSIWVQLGDGAAQHFFKPTAPVTYPASLVSIRPAQKVRLKQLDPGNFAYYTADNRVVIFTVGGSSFGSLVAYPTSMFAADGWGVSIARSSSADVFTEVSGRTIRLAYGALGHVDSLTDPDGKTIAYSYKDALTGSSQPYQGLEYTALTKITYQDGKSKQYLSPSGSLNAGQPLWDVTRITGVIDELNVPYETIVYESGLVKSTELAGGVDKYTVFGNSYSDPLGQFRSFRFDIEYSEPFNLIWRIQQPAGAGCAASGNEFTYDSVTANPTSMKDFNGNLTCYAYDTAGRNVELVRVEGLSQSATCSAYMPANSVLPASARKISTAWHPDWRLEAKRAEPLRIVTSVFNGQPDPFNGGVVAQCAPSSATLPDGKPIAVLCKQVEQATTDVDGRAGFSASLQSGVASRTRTWTYNRYGQVLTSKGPRTDIDDTTTYTYYTDITASHMIGDLSSVKNALNQVTQLTSYNRHGQVLHAIDPNNIVTDNTYDLRLRLTSTTVGGQQTSYGYDAAGLPRTVTLPDSTQISLTYDPAHRLTKITDQAGNSVTYTLDNAGNRVQEQVANSSGTLARTVTRAFDALSRVQQVTGAPN